MAGLSEYQDDKAVNACRSVMIEVLTILGRHREHLVIVGGWVPPLASGGRRPAARGRDPAPAE